MSSPNNIQDELRSLESGLPVNNTQPYSVPDGYFDGLAAAILAKVKNSEVSAQAELAELSPLLAGIPKINPYAVPSSFFQDTIGGLSGLTDETESVILNAIGKEMPYAVPLGYFESVPDTLLTRLTKKEARVVPMFKRTWMRVASAAAIAGALFFGGYQLLSNKNDNATTVATTNSDNQELLASNTQPIEKEIKTVSTKELEEFISTVQITPAATESAKAKTDKSEVEELLKDVSTTEVENFLSAVAVADDEFVTTN